MTCMAFYIPNKQNENIYAITSKIYQIPLIKKVRGVRSSPKRKRTNFITLTKKEPIHDVKIKPTKDFKALL